MPQYIVTLQTIIHATDAKYAIKDVFSDFDVVDWQSISSVLEVE